MILIAAPVKSYLFNPLIQGTLSHKGANQLSAFRFSLFCDFVPYRCEKRKASASSLYRLLWL